MLKVIVLFAIAGLCFVSAAPVSNCTVFCGAIETSCGTTDSGYYDFAGCYGFCEGMLAFGKGGDDSDTDTNTLGCRLNHAVQDECESATSFGGINCIDFANSTCEAFCIANSISCNGTYGSDPLFSYGLCVQSCTGDVTIAKYNASILPVEVSGDSQGCRMHHSLAAVSSADLTHCAHASPLGGNVCKASNPATAAQNIATRFCGAAATICQGDFPYTDIPTCIGTASQFPFTNIETQYGPVNAQSGNNIGCRFFYGTLAALGNATIGCAASAAESPICFDPTTPAATTAPATTAATTSGAAMVNVAILMFAFLCSIALFL